jgi:DNA-binding CsgD family transcriptional regulator
MPSLVLIRAARPVIDQLATALAGTGMRAAVTGARGTMDGGPEAGLGVRVPIIDPNSGRAVGALVLASGPGRANPLTQPLAACVAREIEQRLLDDAALDERLALHQFLQRRRGAKGPFVLVTERRIITNAAADRLVAPHDEPVLRNTAHRLRACRGAEVVRLVLSGGPVTARAEPVPDTRSPAATVLRLVPIADDAEGARPSSGWESLTDTERSVANIVAQGLTNRQAAERLFLSHHTIDFHLRSIFRKVGAESRVDLTRLVVLAERTREGE